jgi:UDPglucose--hexose-1-phosphate uridylyltransferase
VTALNELPHRRLNLLTGEAVLVSPNRMQRPWRGAVEKPAPVPQLQHDPRCYLCPGNERAGGERNPQYLSTYVFTNDYPALLPDAPARIRDGNPLLIQDSVRGTTRVICFSPRHDLTLPEMTAAEIRQVVDVWTEQTTELGRQYRWVQVFENKGEVMGCSNPHPHGQIWAMDVVPTEPAKEIKQQRAYFDGHDRVLLLDYLDAEIAAKERLVVMNRDWLAMVPFWAVWPFEVLLIPRRHVLRLPDLKDSERTTLTDVLKRVLTRYDNLFETSFPYSMGWHGAPFEEGDQSHWQLHAHFYPPLLRSADIKKFMVGFEMLGEAQRDLTPEAAAERLRSVTEVHYRQGGAR